MPITVRFSSFRTWNRCFVIKGAESGALAPCLEAEALLEEDTVSILFVAI